MLFLTLLSSFIFIATIISGTWLYLTRNKLYEQLELEKDNSIKENPYYKKIKNLFEKSSAPMSLLFISALLGGGGGFLLAEYITQTFFVSVFLGIVGFLYTPYYVAEKHLENQYNKIREQLEPATVVMASAMKAGASLPQALLAVAKEYPEPLGKHFQKMVDEINYGSTVESALNRFYQRVPISEVKLLADAINICQKSGGNIIELIESAGSAVRERIVAQSLLSNSTKGSVITGRLVAALPIIFLIGVKLYNPAYFDPLTATFTGKLIMLFALVLLIIGIIWIKSIITFDEL